MNASKIIALHNEAAALGRGPRKHIKRSRLLYLQASRLGSAHASYELGMSYLLDAPKSRLLGFRWLRRAAMEGAVEAQELLGDAYANGTFGAGRNRARALRWYKKASANGSRNAKAALRELE